MLCSGVEGQEAARRYFRSAVAGRRLSHAYLLIGIEGIGKKRFARELAAALLCKRQVAGTAATAGACGECVSCRTINSGNHPLLEMLDASEGKKIEIDTIRATIETVSIRTGERRVLILEDAERLSPPAANALLKTLEEPPPGTLFLLTTSCPAQILETIHSRCHRVPFLPLNAEEFARVLARHEADAALIPRLYRAARGSPGIALRYAAALADSGGEERLRQLLAGVGSDRPETLIDYLPARGKESKRDRMRRFLEFILDGTWNERQIIPEEPHSEIADLAQLEQRAEAGRRALRLAELANDLEANVNPELVLEETARLLR